MSPLQQWTASLLCRMKPRCLLAAVDRLPTINEMQESDTEEVDLDCSSHTLEEYVDSIKELTQPALYPLHGPLRGHRRWMERSCPKVTTVAPSLFLNSMRYGTPWLPVDLSDVLITFSEQPNGDSPLSSNPNLLDRLVGQTLFAGLVWAGGARCTVGCILLSLQRALTSAPWCLIHRSVGSNWVQPLCPKWYRSLWSVKWVKHTKQKMKRGEKIIKGRTNKWAAPAQGVCGAPDKLKMWPLFLEQFWFTTWEWNDISPWVTPWLTERRTWVTGRQEDTEKEVLSWDNVTSGRFTLTHSFTSLKNWKNRNCRFHSYWFTLGTLTYTCLHIYRWPN